MSSRPDTSKNIIVGIDVSNFAYKELRRGGNLAMNIVRKAHGCLVKYPNCHVYLAYDCEGPTFRHKLYPEYKAGRKDNERKKAVADAIKEVKQRAVGCGLKNLQFDGYEADDGLFSLARQCRIREEQCVIISSDKDLYAVAMYDDVHLFSFVSQIGTDPDQGMLVKFVDPVTNQDIYDKYGVEACQWCDYRCVVGDSSDNIKGMKGYGPKRARDVFDQWMFLDDMYKDELAPIGFGEKEWAKWVAFREEQLPFLRRLFRMEDSLPVIQHERMT